MSVVALPGVVTASDRKAFLLNEFAASFDKYVADYGEEPEAFIAIMGGVKQPCRCSWTTQGDSEGMSLAVLAIGAAVLTKELVNPDR